MHSIQSVISGNGKEKTINNNKLNGVDPNNISLVLDNLLKTYESSQLPNIPTLVQTNILIRSMGPVSELDMVSANRSQFQFNLIIKFNFSFIDTGLFT